MALEQTVSRVTFAGDGTTTSFFVPFPVFETGHLVPTLRAADGSATKPVLGVDYQASINRDAAGQAVSATLSMTKPVAAGSKLEVARIVPLVQKTALANQGGTPPRTVEREFDYLTMIDQQQQAEIDRALMAPPGTDPADVVDALLGQNDTLTRAIAAEAAARIAADANLQTQVNAKASQASLNTEISERKAADAALEAKINTKAEQSALAAEATTRAQADANLQTQVNAKASKADLDAEAVARKAADAALQSQIDTKVSKADLTTEAEARRQADIALQTALNAETAARKAADDVHDAKLLLKADVTAVDAALAGKADKAELAAGLDAKADKVHHHPMTEVDGLQPHLETVDAELARRLEDAPHDGGNYARQDGAWKPVIGEEGKPGPKGDPGKDGVAYTILGELSDPADLPANADVKDAYLINGDAWLMTPNGWFNAGPIAGPKGDDGKDLLPVDGLPGQVPVIQPDGTVAWTDLPASGLTQEDKEAIESAIDEKADREEVENAVNAKADKNDLNDYALKRALEDGLNEKANSSHEHPIGDINNIQTVLDAKLSDAPFDSELYARLNGTWKPAAKKSIVVTQAQLDALLANPATAEADVEYILPDAEDTAPPGRRGVTAGYSHSLFLTSAGEVWSCGQNTYGELGRIANGASATAGNFGRIEGLPKVVAAAAGQYHSLFLTEAGEVWTCGYNGSGQLGRVVASGSAGSVNLGKVDGLPRVKGIAAGYDFSLFLTEAGEVLTCGGNAYGQLGRAVAGGSASVTNLGTVESLAKAKGVAAGYCHALFLTEAGEVWTCGQNAGGQLGRAVATGSAATANLGKVDGLPKAKGAAGGSYFSLFLAESGDVWSCGDNGSGQLGRVVASGSASVTNLGKMDGLAQAAAVAGGYAHSLFLTPGGDVWSCGQNSYGQLGGIAGNGGASSVNLGKVDALSSGAMLAAGHYHSLFLADNGALWSCGQNNSGQLGRAVAGGGAGTVNLGKLDFLLTV